MIIIDAFWEKRNLGEDTVEFEVELGDSANVLNAIAVNEKQYNVVKVPAGNAEVAERLQGNGYRFVEGTIHFTHPGELQLNSVQRRILDAVLVEDMNNADIEELFSEIRNGMFDSDRVYLDSYFSKEQAAERYVGWMNDEIARGAGMKKFVYKGKNIGFGCIRANGESLALAGMYNKYKKSGLGVVLVAQNYLLTKACGRVTGIVSMNNVGVWKLYQQLGYKIASIEYIFVSHKRDNIVF